MKIVCYYSVETIQKIKTLQRRERERKGKNKTMVKKYP